jgi:hypothetical protein
MSPYMFLILPFMFVIGWLGADGSMGPGMMGHSMMLGPAGDRWTGVEVRYLPVAALTGPGLSAPATLPPQTVVVGVDSGRAQRGLFSLGLQGNVGVQLAPPADVGNWVTPYGGILPRVGTDLGPLRVDAGLLAGGGVMGRQVSGGTGTLLEVRPLWTLEPRLELGIQGERISGALVGTYLWTPYPGEIGGLSAGIRVAFKPGTAKAAEPEHTEHGSDGGHGTAKAESEHSGHGAGAGHGCH